MRSLFQSLRNSLTTPENETMQTENPQNPESIHNIPLLYPVHPRVRWGWGKPAHPLLEKILEKDFTSYDKWLDEILSLQQDLLDIPLNQPTDDLKIPHWNNDYFTGLDGLMLYTLLRKTNPALYIEIGSGHSTRFVRQAIQDGTLQTRIVSIDPQPRAEIDAICDEVIRQPVECLDLSVFQRLDKNDILFVDGSHYVFMNTDTVVMFLEVFPNLKSGVLYGIHDICLPYDYPQPLHGFHFSEQYLLAAALLAGDGYGQIVFPTAFLTQSPQVQERLKPLWENERNPGIPQHGSAFWLRKH